MKIIYTNIFYFCLICFLAGCQTNTPDNLASSQYQESELTKAAMDAEQNYVLTRNGLNNEAKYPWFTGAYKNYNANRQAISELKAVNKNLSFIVFGGSWCPDTKKALPRFYKVVEESQIPAKKIALYGVDHEKKSQDKPVNGKTKSDEYGIHRVPVFIIFYDGNEIGRLNEKPDKSLEEDMVQLIKENANKDI